MYLKISELKTKKGRELGANVTWQAIHEATGIDEATLRNMDKGRYKQVRVEYIDALATYFNVADSNDLIVLEPVSLPVGTVREDIKGKKRK